MLLEDCLLVSGMLDAIRQPGYGPQTDCLGKEKTRVQDDPTPFDFWLPLLAKFSGVRYFHRKFITVSVLSFASSSLCRPHKALVLSHVTLLIS